MAVIDFLVSDPPLPVFMFPAIVGAGPDANSNPVASAAKELMVFQYWPQTLQDDYQVEYAEHNIPGGSHPLYQWVGGRGRTLTFQAVFTAEINQTRPAFGASGASPIPLVPSAFYTVNVAAALSKLKSWQRPEYDLGGRQGLTTPPPILTMVMPGTQLNGIFNDAVNVILRSAPITYESWFPNGEPRVATVDITLSEIIQSPGGADSASAGTNVKFIDRRQFRDHGLLYQNTGLNNRPLIGGSF